MKLSIIIPVYNVEKYIKKCLLSCVTQDISLDKYEIIVVNDGSPDNSKEIIDILAKQYANIHVIEQENSGLSMARNNGLKVAIGEYIWFVDSDDWIENYCLKSIINKLEETTPDLLQLQYRYVYDDSNKNRDADKCIIDNVISGKKQLVKGGVPAPAQFTIYKRQFLIDNNLMFYPRIYHEDSEFKPRAVYCAERCVSYDEIVYNYYQRLEGAITSCYKLKNGIDGIFVMNSLDSFAKNNNFKLKYRNCFNREIGLIMNTVLYGMRKLNKKDYDILKNKLLENKHLFIKMINSRNSKYMIEGICFYVNITFGLWMHKLIR